jgi:hypothetical protein
MAGQGPHLAACFRSSETATEKTAVQARQLAGCVAGS